MAPPASSARTDPLAVAIGNASLFGVGYLLLGRRRFALVAVAGSVVLLTYVVSVPSVWTEIVLVLWWLAGIAHGWFLAGGRTGRGPAVRRQLVIALAVTVPVLLVAALLRWDTARVEGEVTAARDAGDCGGVLAAQDRVWLGNRVADAPLAASGDATVRTCHRLRTAASHLAAALRDGDADELRAGYGILANTLTTPGNVKIVETVQNRFLRGLPTGDPCDTAALTDWLRDRHPSVRPLNQAAGTVRRTAPAALVGCADDEMDDKNWDRAKSRYRQLLDLYPDDERAGRAKDGEELANVSGLLDGGSDEQPKYCAHPAKYGNAPAYGDGTNKAMFFGNSSYTDRLPDAWHTGDPAHAALIVCADDDKDGRTVQTCTYRSDRDGRYYAVTFHEIAIHVRAYELRTGKKVADRTLEISGSSCPATIHWSYYSSSPYGNLGDTGPDPDQYVRESDSDVTDAFRPLISR